MLPGPICSVELLTIARRRRYFLVRVVYAGILLLFLANICYESRNWYSNRVQLANLTAQFFGTFSVLQLLVVVLIGPALAAGTIAVERERRTIEYLFACPLSNLEIVLGKLAARLLHTICLVLVGVPVLAIAMLMGGIAPEALLLLSVLTLSTIVMVATLSMAVSVWTARARDAVIKAYLALAMLFALPLLALLLKRTVAYDWIGPINEQFLLADPFWVFAEIMDKASSNDPSAAWWLAVAMVRNQLVFSAFMLLAATLAVRRVHLRQSGKSATRRRWRFQLLRGEIGNNPMLWKEVFAEPAASRLGILGYGVAAIVLAVVIWQTIYWFDEAMNPAYRPWQQHGEMYVGYASAAGMLLGLGGLLLIAARSACSITSEKERQTWDSVLGTPLEGREILRAKLLGNVWAMRWLLVPLAIVWLPGVLIVPELLFVIPFYLATLLAVTLFASALGVLLSLWSKSSLRAMAGTLAISIFVGGGYMFCCSCFMFAGPGPGHGIEIVLAPCVPYLLLFPGMAVVEGFWRHGSESGGFVAAYGLGVIGYFVAGLVLYWMAVERFDSMTGRVVYNWQQRRGPPGGRDVILAQLANEP